MAVDLTRFDFHAFRFMHSDDVEEMTAEEVGQYILLLCESWLGGKEASLPDNKSVLAKKARARRVSPKVLAKFPIVETEVGPRRRNPVLYEEWKATKDRLEKAVQSGHKGSRIKKEIKGTLKAPLNQPLKDSTRVLGLGWYGLNGLDDLKEEEMSIKRKVADACLRILGINPPFSFMDVNNQSGQMLNRAVRAYGGEDVILNAFEDWAESHKGEQRENPIADFVKVMPGILAGTIVVQENPDLADLGATLWKIGNQVFTNQQLAALLKEFKKDEVEIAYQEFVYSLNEDDLKYAVFRFCNGGARSIIIDQRKREETRQKQETLAAAQQKKLAFDAEVELDRIKEERKRDLEELERF